MALLEKPEGVTLPLLLMLPLRLTLLLGVGGARFEGLRKGDSGREVGRVGGRAPGPSDWENLERAEGVLSGLKFGFSVVERLKVELYKGVVGVRGKSSEVPEERLRARWTGRKIPAPGVEVVKYWVPSTAPSFLPRAAKGLLSSTPAKTPFLPRMVPTNLTVPCMPPGTSTASPMSMSWASCMVLWRGGEAAPVRALREACRAMVLEEKLSVGEDSAGRRGGRFSPLGAVEVEAVKARDMTQRSWAETSVFGAGMACLDVHKHTSTTTTAVTAGGGWRAATRRAGRAGQRATGRGSRGRAKAQDA
jgi:hypothetical protein